MDVSAAGFTDMQVTAAGETGEYFLYGIFKHMPFSIQLSDPADYHGADFAFVAHTMNRASAYRQDAELFLQNILAENPGALGVSEGDRAPDGPLLSLPSYGRAWSRRHPPGWWPPARYAALPRRGRCGVPSGTRTPGP